MNPDKIAIVVDSATDVPENLKEGHSIFTVPLYINYSNESYADQIEITTEEVCDRLPIEIPKTSLPTIGSVREIYRKVLDEGYEKIIVISISSGLSGTHNVMKLAAEGLTGAEFFFADTLNIGIGAGITVLTTAHMIKRGLSFEEITKKVNRAIKNTAIFFIVDTLKYLHKGGRIGSVLYTFGSALDLKPVISCNEKGTYYTAAKSIGKNQAIQKAMDLAEKFAKKFDKVNVAIACVRAEDQAKQLYQKAKEGILNAQEFILSGVCPCLTVHTGPGTLGICVQEVV